MTLRLVPDLEQQSTGTENPDPRVTGRSAAAQETPEEFAAHLAYLEEMDWLRRRHAVGPHIPCTEYTPDVDA